VFPCLCLYQDVFLFKIWFHMRIIYEGIISAVYNGQGFICFSMNSRLSSNYGVTFVAYLMCTKGHSTVETPNSWRDCKMMLKISWKCPGPARNL
jgi:hypothetical protein